MRFNPLVSLLLASLVSASPAARARAIVQRQACTPGVACDIQEEVNAARTYMTTAIGIIQGSVDAVVADVNSCATQLVQAELNLETDIGAVTADVRTQLEAQVVSAITGLIDGIRSDVTEIQNSNITLTVDLTASLTAVTNAISAIEVVVGPIP